jgi:S-formylglutathione hydrolase FrmB
MALFQASFLSKTLKKIQRFTAFLPTDGLVPPEALPKLPLKTLYLLHGYTGSSTVWLTDIALGELAALHGIAIIAPDGGNDFYVDHEERGEFYGEFIGHELVEYTRTVFPLSDKREGTFIGGVSMGGYGALRNGLKYGDVFSRVIALSPAIVTPDFFELQPTLDLIGANRAYFGSVLGNLDHLAGSDKDLLALPGRIAQAGGPLPGIYLACGENDIFAPLNRRFDQLLTSLKIPHTYEEGPGTHETPVFQRYLSRGLGLLDIERPPVLPNPFLREAGR